MAENTNYIGVAMGMDVTDLKAGISEANKQIQLANSEFKAATGGMKNWQDSAEGITAKMKQLETVLKAQKSKLNGLQAEYEKVAKEQGEGSEAARKLLVQLNNQKAVVASTERELKLYEDAAERAAEENEDLAESLRKVKEEMNGMGQGTKEAAEKTGGFATVAKGVVGGIAAIGGAVAGAVGSLMSFAESTRETRENMAKLETSFEGAGHSAETAQNTYNELYGILGDEGAATEAAQQLAKLSKDEASLAANTRILTGVMAEYGSSIPTEGLAEGMAATAAMGSVQGTLADALEWQGVNLDDYNAKLATMTTEEERAAYIQQTLTDLYGESADAFAEKNKSIIEAREAEAALAQQMAELGAIAEPIMTTLKLIAVDLLKTIQPFVELIGEGLTGALNGTAGATDTLAEGIGGLIDSLVGKVMEILPTILELIVQLIPSIANTLLDALPLLLETLVNLTTQVINMLSTLLPQILMKIVELIPMLINQLVSAIPQLLQAATTLLMSIVRAIPTIVTSLLDALPTVITTIINAVIDSIPILLDAAIQLLNAIVDAIPVLLDSLTTNLPSIIDAIITGLLDALPMLLDATITFWMAIIDAIPVIIDALMVALPDIIEAILSSIKKALPKLFETAKTLFGKIIDAVGDLVKKLPSKMGEVITSIVEGLKKGISKIKTIGSDIIKGLWDGIKDMAGWIGKKIKGFGEDVLGGIKSFFGIKSPSKLMRDEVGQYIGQGIGAGVLDSIPSVKKQLGKFSSYVADNLGNIKTGLMLDANGGGTSTGGRAFGGSTVVNAGLTVNYNGALSRKQIKQLENDNYTAIRTRLKAGGAF